MILNSINFPNELVDAIKNNTLVIFAGAGVSMGSPTCFPNFIKLTNQIAKGSIYEGEPYADCDAFLGKLEAGGIPVREKTANVLGNSLAPYNREHEAIINLFSSPEHVRIVTTNYDHMFEKVLDDIKAKYKVYDSPALPLGNDVSGIVHIHGNVNCQEYMVLTDVDFGRAYLTEGYVSRFLVQLFSSYTVLFIGYSYDDTIVRYLTRAMYGKDNKGRYILTNSDNPIWESLNIQPIKFETIDDDYEPMINSLEKLGNCVKYDLVDWDIHLGEISSEPPMDETFSSEVQYFIDNKSETHILANRIEGGKWLKYLDNKAVFDNLFVTNHKLSADEYIWGNWICKKIIGKEDDSFLSIIAKHGNRFSKEFAEMIIDRILENDFSDSMLPKYTLLMNDYLNDDYRIMRLIEKSYRCNQKSAINKMFKRFWNLHFEVENRYRAEEIYRYSHEFLGDANSVNHVWKICFDYFRDIKVCKEFLLFWMSVLEDIHSGYSEAGMASKHMEPYVFSYYNFENEKEQYRENMVDVTVRLVREMCRTVANADEYFYKQYIINGIKSDSVFIRKLVLTILRENDVLSSNEIFDCTFELFGYENEREREQIFKLIRKIYGNLSKKNQDKIVKYVASIEKSRSGDEYLKYSWCIWMAKFSEDKRIKRIKEDLEQNRGYRPNNVENYDADNETESVYSTSVITYDELKNLSYEGAVDRLISFFNEKHSKVFCWDALDTFTQIVRDKTDWAINVAGILNKKTSNEELWEAYFAGIRVECLTLDDAVSLLSLVNSGKYSCEKTALTAQLLWDIVHNENYKNNIKDYEAIIYNQANIILSNRLEEEPENCEMIDLVSHTTVGIVVRAVVYLCYLTSDGDIDKKYFEMFDSILNLHNWERKVAVASLTMFFNFAFLHGKEWTEERVVPFLEGSDKEDFIAAWDGITYLSRSINLDMLDTFESIYKKAVNHVKWLQRDARKVFIELYLPVMMNMASNPLETAIPTLYKETVRNDIVTFVKAIQRRLGNLEDENQTKWWNSWLQEFFQKRAENIPQRVTMDEMKELLYCLPKMKSIYGDAVEIICKMNLPKGIRGDWMFELADSETATSEVHSTVKLLLRLLENGSLQSNAYVADLLKKMSGYTKEEKRQLNNALLKRNIQFKL